jgi:hypothetical protein
MSASGGKVPVRPKTETGAKLTRAVTTTAVPVLALEGATSYWASVVANPPGHTSVFGASKRRASLVAPGEPARPVSLRRV